MTATKTTIRLSEIANEARDYIDQVPALDPSDSAKPQIVEQVGGKLCIVDGFHRTAGQLRWCDENGVSADECEVTVVIADDADLIDLVGECRSSQYAIISRGPWPSGGVDDAVEIMFEDGTTDPFSLHLSSSSFADFLPGAPEPGREWIVTLWTQKAMRPHKALERPAKWRRVESLPCLAPWSEPN